MVLRNLAQQAKLIALCFICLKQLFWSFHLENFFPSVVMIRVWLTFFCLVTLKVLLSGTWIKLHINQSKVNKTKLQKNGNKQMGIGEVFHGMYSICRLACYAQHFRQRAENFSQFLFLSSIISCSFLYHGHHPLCCKNTQKIISIKLKLLW